MGLGAVALARVNKMVCMLKRLGSDKGRFALGLAVVVAAILLTACAAGEQGGQPTATPTRDPEQPKVSVQAIGRSLTIGEVTVTLDEVTHISTSASESVRFRYTFEHAQPNVHVSPRPMGRNITRANGTTHRLIGFDDGSYADTTLVDGIYLNSSIPSSGENLTASLGVYEIPASDDTGDITINIIGEKRRSEEHGFYEIPTQAEFAIEEGRYRIPKIDVLPTKFQIVIEPANDAARRIHHSENQQEMSLTDATGFSYPPRGIQTTYDNLSPVGFQDVRLRYTGIIPKSVSSLTLRIRGGTEMIGPFVFEDVRVVPAADVPDEAAATPRAPGVAATGTATPASASK